MAQNQLYLDATAELRNSDVSEQSVSFHPLLFAANSTTSFASFVTRR